ncbi:MAG: DMT family transporter [Desulfosoma sp.]|uniref:DMT family transporter n=1 Tax=Desulfosoma sp. TaxID=2603217 RepID=UPI00404B687D
MHPKAKGYLAALTACVIWGGSFVATKVALLSFTPHGLLVLRFAMACAILVPAFLVFQREVLRLRDLGLFCLLGFMEPGLYFLCETRGLLYTSASVASLIIGSIPVFVMLLASIFLKEPLHLRTALGTAMTLVGIAFLVHKDLAAASVGPSLLKGNLLMMGAALCASVYTIVSRSLSARYRPMTLTTIQATFATVFFTLLAFTDESSVVLSPLSASALSSLIFLGVLATLGAFWLYNFSLSVLPASQVAVLINLIPLVTVLSARALLNETLSWAQLVGALLILAGVRVSTSSHQGAEREGLFKILQVLRSKSRRAHGGFPLAAPQQHIDGSSPAVPRSGAGKGQD